MLLHTQGIVLGYTKFRETSIIAKIYIREGGLRSYIINGVRSAKPNKAWSMALFQPLQLLRMVVYHRERAGIERIKEAKALHLYTRLGSDWNSLSCTHTLSRMLLGILRADGQQDHALFDFMQGSLVALDGIHGGYTQFFLQFFTKLTDHMGVSLGEQFKLWEANGKTCDAHEIHRFLHCVYSSPYQATIPHNERVTQRAWRFIMEYYRQHFSLLDVFSLPLRIRQP